MSASDAASISVSAEASAFDASASAEAAHGEVWILVAAHRNTAGTPRPPAALRA
ncbi:hypothetical protein [Streptomyces nitrosporeus]|uniref:hypothetical protein n=1 Tax=Streptomyces nitrosporeus TaxID=28894 RepID=UPI00142E9DCF|nr:hypothetical protein [Streptomyces nitrosporeus]